MAAAAVALGVVTAPADAARRVALVIGNSSYVEVPPLANPANDAAAIADAFRRLDFDEVVLRTDLDYGGFRRALVDFARTADGADVAIAYYAGHGIEVSGRNYLIPIDAHLREARDADLETMPLDHVVSALEGAKQLRVVILDACRDNPFGARMRSVGGSRSVGRGLARVETPGNTLVAYAAKGGTTADDGKGDHSPFTAALLDHLEEPGVEIRLMFGRVRDEVLRRTDNDQEPFVYGAVGGLEIYLKAGSATVNVKAPPAAAGIDKEALFWTSVKDSGDAAILQTYLDRYPEGAFSGLARVMIDKLKQQIASTGPTVEADPPIPTGSPATPRRVLTEGYNGQVFVKGSFTNLGGGKWIERNSENGDRSLHFRSVAHTRDRVLLYDDSRDIHLELNLRRKETRVQIGRGKPWFDFYKITKVEK